ncbi:uncharacterized protein BJ212DRAFT_1327991 [Suillus subaureus]|uniref:Secreted peptide n=1 Tax=Suillus subaureus TaxID=48587 RepID=A0A9P7EIG0_9AGAM|nr:uncharacterized protein BJ212DRAFT_1327991 [Suillus subaureus]KAG1822470.1 hypothetical protein BJ212DRAFT_1327991 [Suillus subaureus]
MIVVVSTWVLVTARMVFAFPLIHVRVKNHTEIDDEGLLVPLCCLASLLFISTWWFPQFESTQCRRKNDGFSTHSNMYLIPYLRDSCSECSWLLCGLVRFDMDDPVIAN